MSAVAIMLSLWVAAVAVQSGGGVITNLPCGGAEELD